MKANLLPHFGLLDDVDPRPDEQAAALRVLTAHDALDLAWMLGVEG